MSDSNLKPCPFCGSDKIHCFDYDPYDGYQGNLTSYIVRCRTCGVEVSRRTKVEAIAAWNRRVLNEL